jgi:hypothetical protein
MKNTTLIMCLIAALAIFTSPVDADRVDQSIPITLSVPSPCVGEVVSLSGTLDTVITFNRRHRSRQRSRSFMLYLNAQGIAGIGEITGRAYQVNDAEFKIPFNRVLLNGQGTVSSNIYLEVTNAPGPDGLTFTWWLDETVHVTFNADGTVTVNVDNFTADCGSCAGCWDY